MSARFTEGVRTGLTKDRLTEAEFTTIAAGEDEAVNDLLRGLGPDGGSASREMLEALVRTAFHGGHVVTIASVNHRLTEKGGAQ